MESSINDTQHIEDHIKSSISIKQSILLDTTLVHKIDEVAKVCVNAYKNGNKVILAGNGGSAADSQHIAAEFVSRFRFDRPGLPSIALSTDTSMLTAIGNDYGYKNVFSRQIIAHGEPNDTLIVYTTSGKSENIIELVNAARTKLKNIIALTGANTKLLSENCDVIISVNSDDTPKIQEVHAIAGHMICESVEHVLFANS